jgi:Short C-terminal domain
MPLMRRRRPLLRSAAVGAGAYAMGKRRQERAEQEQQPASQPQQQAAAPSGGGLAPDAIEQLQQLGKLHDQGVLTDEEFDQQKAKVLAG